jgi:hypothetical protein
VTRKIVVLGFDGCQSLDVTGPLEVFAAANAALVRSRSRAARYDVSFASLRRRPVRAESGAAPARAGSVSRRRSSSCGSSRRARGG